MLGAPVDRADVATMTNAMREAFLPAGRDVRDEMPSAAEIIGEEQKKGGRPRPSARPARRA